MPTQPPSHQREVFGSGRHVELQVIHRLSNHQTRTQDFHFSRSRRLDVEQAGGIAQGTCSTGLAVFHLDQGIGFIDGTAQECISPAQHKNQRRDAGNQPACIEQHVEQAQQIDFVVVLHLCQRHGGHGGLRDIHSVRHHETRLIRRTHSSTPKAMAAWAASKAARGWR